MQILLTYLTPSKSYFKSFIGGKSYVKEQGKRTDFTLAITFWKKHYYFSPHISVSQLPNNLMNHKTENMKQLAMAIIFQT